MLQLAFSHKQKRASDVHNNKEGRVGIALACTVSRNNSVAPVVDTVRACAHRVVEVLQSVI